MSDPTTTLLVYLAIYLAVVISSLLGLAVTGKILGERHKTKSSKSNICIDDHAHGLFASSLWAIWLRGPISLLITIFGLMPSAIFTICFILGPILALSEEWDVKDGILYILSNLLGLLTALTDNSPTSSHGMALDVVLSLWAMLISTTAIGLVAGLSLIIHWSESIPRSLFAFLRYLFLYVPVFIVLSCFLFGVILASIEGWSFSDGFYFIVASICQMANPLVNVEPVTAGGMFVEVLSVCVELGFAGAIIGMIGAHSVIEVFLAKIEGHDVNKKMENLANEMSHISEVHHIKNETYVNAMPIMKVLRKQGLLPAQPTIEELKALFVKLDKDGNGELDVDEVKQALAVIGVESKDLPGFFESMDVNGDSKISQNEFLNMMAEEIATRCNKVVTSKSRNEISASVEADNFENKETCGKDSSEESWV